MSESLNFSAQALGQAMSPSNDGCQRWMDSENRCWCMDSWGYYSGIPGALFFWNGIQWQRYEDFSFADRASVDGCIYWRDSRGLYLCRDVKGSYGPAKQQYHSEDGRLWFGDGDAWVEMSASASKVMKATKKPQDGKEQRRGAKGNSKAGSKSQKGRRAFVPFEQDMLAAINQDLEVPREILIKLFGKDGTQVIETQNAHLNAMFDLDCSQRKPVLWPELPLRL